MSNSPTPPPVAGLTPNPTPLPARASQSDARVQAALAASARAEASLASLFRAIQQLGNGVGGAREANESLTLELEGLRDLLAAASDRQQTFERKLAELERVLDRTRKEHAAERAFLIDQQDLFLLGLLNEQELALKQRDADLEALRRRLAEFERRDQVALAPTFIQATAPVAAVELGSTSEGVMSDLEHNERTELEQIAQKLAEDRERARDTVARLRAQRDEAQQAAARIASERDLALLEIHRLRSELGGPRIPLSTRPPSAETRAPTSAPSSFTSTSSPLPNALGEASNDQTISSVLSPPGEDGYPATIASRLSLPSARLSPRSAMPPSEPPEELRRALTSASSQPSPESGTAPKPKPDPSTRPLVGYSLGTGSIAPERFDGAGRLSSNSPKGQR
jgi:hypothetical protein